MRHFGAIERIEDQFGDELEPDQNQNDGQNHWSIAPSFLRPPIKKAANQADSRFVKRIETAFVVAILARVENTPTETLSFEDALEQLEAIVEAMEAGDVPLADLLAKFENGNKLLKICEARLKDAEMKIELLKKQKDGPAFVPFSPERER
jgi:exodeoxyribonuclease VII small subunit